MNDAVMTAEQVRAEVAPVVARAGSIVIVGAADYQGAADFLKAVKGAQKRVTDLFGPMKAKAHAAWKEITGTEAETLKPLADAESTIKAKMVAWQTEQERIRQVEQRRLQALADEAARKEREKVEAAARAQREKEAAARAEQERQEMLAAQAETAAERAAAIVAAEEARRKADAAAAKAEVREDAAANVAPAPVVTVASAAPVVKGQSLRKTYRAQVVDVAAVPREWLMVNDSALQAFAKATKGAVPVAGVRFIEETSLASASR